MSATNAFATQTNTRMRTHTHTHRQICTRAGRANIFIEHVEISQSISTQLYAILAFDDHTVWAGAKSWQLASGAVQLSIRGTMVMSDHEEDEK